MDEKVYAVRNREGKWFRRIGYGGAGQSWSESFSDATLYRNLPQARSRCTYFAKMWPDYGVPVVVVLSLSESEVLDESDRVNVAVKKISDRNAECARRRKAWEDASPRCSCQKH